MFSTLNLLQPSVGDLVIKRSRGVPDVRETIVSGHETTHSTVWICMFGKSNDQRDMKEVDITVQRTSGGRSSPGYQTSIFPMIHHTCLTAAL